MSSQLAKVKKIYASYPELRKTDVETLQSWIKTQPHLPELREVQIILFLHSCKYQLTDAQITIENYCKFRTTSVLAQDFNEQLIRQTFSTFFTGFMPKTTKDGDAVLFLKILNTRPDAYNCLEHLKLFVTTIVLHFHQFGPANSLIVVCDTKGTSFGHLFKLNLSAMSQFVFFLEQAAPVKIKYTFYLNTAPIIQRLLNIVKPFMKRSHEEKTKFYGESWEGLFEHVPRDCLPGDYGGLLPTTEELKESTVAIFFNHWQLLKWLETQKIDERKRVKKEKGFFQKLFSWSDDGTMKQIP